MRAIPSGSEPNLKNLVRVMIQSAGTYKLPEQAVGLSGALHVRTEYGSTPFIESVLSDFISPPKTNESDYRWLCNNDLELLLLKKYVRNKPTLENIKDKSKEEIRQLLENIQLDGLSEYRFPEHVLELLKKIAQVAILTDLDCKFTEPLMDIDPDSPQFLECSNQIPEQSEFVYSLLSEFSGSALVLAKNINPDDLSLKG